MGLAVACSAPDPNGPDGICAGGTAPGPDDLYASTRIPRLYIDLPAISFDLLSQCKRDDNTDRDPPWYCDYQPGTLRYEDDDGRCVVLRDIGVRLKGRWTFQPLSHSRNTKPAFKLKLDDGAPGQMLAGVDSLTLNNMREDPTMTRECLGFSLYRAAGVPAPRCNHARVYVNDEYYGLYSDVETMDETFVAARFGGPPIGNLYDTYNDVYFTDFDRRNEGGAIDGGDRGQAGDEPGAQEARFQLETNEDAGDTRDLTALIDAIYVYDAGDDAEGFVASVEPVVDLDEWLRVAAVQAFLTDWDGFFGARNNYKVYRDPTSGRFSIFPWGIDQTFGYQDNVYYSGWNYAIDHHHSRREPSLFSRRCFGYSAACQARYRAVVADVLEAVRGLEALDAPARATLYDGSAIELPAGVPLMAPLAEFLAISGDAIAEDERRPLPGGNLPTTAHAKAVGDMIDYLTRRGDEVEDQLENVAVSEE